MEQIFLSPTSETEVFMDDILKLDLTMIKLKLQDTEEGRGWSETENFWQ